MLFIQTLFLISFTSIYAVGVKTPDFPSESVIINTSSYKYPNVSLGINVNSLNIDGLVKEVFDYQNTISPIKIHTNSKGSQFSKFISLGSDKKSGYEVSLRYIAHPQVNEVKYQLFIDFSLTKDPNSRVWTEDFNYKKEQYRMINLTGKVTKVFINLLKKQATVKEIFNYKNKLIGYKGKFISCYFHGKCYLKAIR